MQETGIEEQFAIAIAEAYKTTPQEDRGLRDLIVEVSNEHIDHLRQKESFRKVLLETVGFAFDLALFRLPDPIHIELENFTCEMCGISWYSAPEVIPS